MADQSQEELGSLWLRESKAGNVFMTGTILGQDVVVFRNTRKPEGSKQPEWRVYRSKPREASAAAHPPTVRPAASSLPLAEGFEDEDAIPF